MIHYKAPEYTPSSNNIKMFLCGSIDLGNAQPWQDKVVDLLSDLENLEIYNPRRDDWDSTWVQSIDFQPFNQQVNWELDHITTADIVLVYFDPKGQAPITLLELGILSQLAKPVIVCCPDGFWRKGNVDIISERYNLHSVKSFDDMVLLCRTLISTL